MRAVCCLLGVALVCGGCDRSPFVCPAGSVLSEGLCVFDDAGGRGDGGVDAGDGDARGMDAGGMDAGGMDANVLRDAAVEAGCVPSSAVDVPDLMGSDTNCDGIDGDVDDAVFVSAAGTASGIGSREDPAQTLTRGIEIAQAMGRSQVLVATGEYAERVIVVAGISVYGGYDPASWARSDARATVRAIGPVLEATDISTMTTISTLAFEAADGDEPGESSIAASIVRSHSIVLERLDLRAGDGGPGSSPVRASAPPQAPMGERGATGVRSGHCSEPTGSEPFGGKGGAFTTGCGCNGGGMGGQPEGYYRASGGRTIAQVGFHGYRAESCGLVLGNGARGGAAGASGTAGGRGSDGEPGIPGTSGAGGAPIGRFSASGYLPARGEDGSRGGPGGGGGGGGGGFGCYLTDFCIASGGGGGGGGAGGCGGAPGMGGGGGGASIALFLWESSPTLVRVNVHAGDGGAGGTGARGGEGGRGGEPGPAGTRYTSACESVPTNGGPGGRGGQGGEGGGGGGGTGGPSIGILFGENSSEASDSADVTITTGMGGVGGAGGGGAASGRNGIVQSAFEVGG